MENCIQLLFIINPAGIKIYDIKEAATEPLGFQIVTSRKNLKCVVEFLLFLIY